MARGAAAAGAVVLALAACGHSSGSGSRVPTVVPGAASAWQAVAVTAGARSAELPPDVRRRVTPLLASRALERPEPVSAYGLDRPQAVLTYRARSGATTVVDVGSVNFDRHFVYAQRRGRVTVYLVPADSLRAALAIVGIDVRPPD